MATYFDSLKNNIPIYIIDDSSFIINKEKSSALKLLGKSSIEHLLSKFSLAKVISLTDLQQGNYIVGEITLFIFSSYFLIDENSIKTAIDKLEKGQLSFDWGYLLKGNERIDFSLKIENSSVQPFKKVEDYPLVLSQLKREILLKHLSNGVLIDDLSSITIDCTVEIESGARIMQNNVIQGNTQIKSGAVLKPNCIIENSVVGNDSVITASVLKEAIVGEKSLIGPNAYLRPNSVVGDNCRIGDFVEVKNANIGNGSKASHLSYVGDADIGKNVNIGCGVVFVNYNGKVKQRSVVGDNSFIGSNSNIIAPVNIDKNVYIAAGTTVTDSLEELDMCIGRCRQIVKKEKAKKYLKNF